MERSALAWLLGTAAIMLGMPGAARLASMDVFTVLVVLEFFIVGPLWALLTGIFAGWKIKTRWWLAIADPLLFLCGSWIFLEMWEPDFLYYAFSYLMVGSLTACVTAVIRKNRTEK